jgi:sugar O-acyltransferase (sialic acid O-acetyltransferase NeuD family)
MILFGVRSPLVIEYEETLARLGIPLAAAVSVSGAPRLLDRRMLVDLADFAAPPGATFLAPAFAPLRRRALWDQALALGLVPASALVDPTAVIPRSLRLGAGTFINAGAVIGGLTLLGDGVLVNRSASLGHHCVLADFVSVGPGAVLAGNIHVGAGSVIGAGAIVLPNVRIGAGAIVSAGAVVRKHVADGTLVIGNPALPHRFNPLKSSLAVEDGE